MDAIAYDQSLLCEKLEQRVTRRYHIDNVALRGIERKPQDVGQMSG